MSEAAQRLRALLTLRALPGLGDRRRRELLERYGSARAATRAARRLLSARHDPGVVAARVEHAMRTAADCGARIVGMGEADYPCRLLDLPDPPVVLFMRGDAALLARPAVAIVGTRRHTAYGGEAARALAGPLARSGFAIVSGLAHGIDRCAHEAALDAGGATIAFVGCGVDIVYPRAHRVLVERIVGRGLVASEFMPGEPARRHHFPRRNRLIAALSNAVVVVEAPAKSGALITAEHASDLGREVFAVPGPIGRDSSAGTNALLRDGASIVIEAADVMDAVMRQMTPAEQSFVKRVPGDVEPQVRHGVRGRAHSVDPAAGSTAASPRGALWRALDVEPRHIDDLARVAGLAHADALARLLDLELEGWVRQTPGQRFARCIAA